MHHLRAEFPLHYALFQQVSSHLASEVNSEEDFSLSGTLSNPNSHTSPQCLSDLTKANRNRPLSDPAPAAVLEKYLKIYRKAPEQEGESDSSFSQESESEYSDRLDDADAADDCGSELSDV